MSIQKIALWTCDAQTRACDARPMEDSYGELRAERYDPELPEGWAVLAGGTHICDKCQDFNRLQSYPLGTIVSKGDAVGIVQWERRAGGWHRLTDNPNGTYTGFESERLVGWGYQPVGEKGW